MMRSLLNYAVAFFAIILTALVYGVALLAVAVLTGLPLSLALERCIGVVLAVQLLLGRPAVSAATPLRESWLTLVQALSRAAVAVALALLVHWILGRH